MYRKSSFSRLRKRASFFMIAFLLAIFSMAQKNHLSFSVNGIGSNNYLLKEGVYNKYLKSGFLISPGGELLYSHDLSDKYTFHTGISYQYREYYADSSNKYYRYGELAIPAVISLHILRKQALKLDWSTGVYFNQLLHLDGFISSSTTFYRFNYHDYYKNPSNFGFDFYSDIKLRCPVIKDREIFIAPFWMYHLIKKDYYEGMTSHSLGLKIGYTFKSF